MAEELRLWRFDVGKASPSWVKGKAWLLATESALPALERSLGITVGTAATSDELLTATGWIGFGPEVRLMQRRLQIGADDTEYQRLAGLAGRATDKADATTKREAARLRADALIAAADEARG